MVGGTGFEPATHCAQGIGASTTLTIQILAHQRAPRIIYIQIRAL